MMFQGFVHEHTRPDRDQFVRVKLEDVKKGTEGNFVKRTRGDSQWFERGDVDTLNTPFGIAQPSLDPSLGMPYFPA